MKSLTAIALLLVALCGCRATSNDPNVIHGVTWTPTDSEYAWLGGKLTEFVNGCGDLHGKRVAIGPVGVRTGSLKFNTRGCLSKLKGRLMERGALVVERIEDNGYHVSVDVVGVATETRDREDEYRIVFSVALKFIDARGKVVHAGTYKVDSRALGNDRPR